MPRFLALLRRDGNASVAVLGGSASVCAVRFHEHAGRRTAPVNLKQQQQQQQLVSHVAEANSFSLCSPTEPLACDAVLWGAWEGNG